MAFVPKSIKRHHKALALTVEDSDIEEVTPVKAKGSQAGKPTASTSVQLKIVSLLFIPVSLANFLF